MRQGMSHWKPVDFDESMQAERHSSEISMTGRVLGIDGEELMELFRSLFETNDPSRVTPEERPRIPKIIHQIWLGGEVPEPFEPFMQSWIDAHLGRGWRYRLWTDEDASGFGLFNQGFFDESDNPGVKSDLLKWEIVHRHGGVYVDVDFECLGPLDLLHHTQDFYVGIQPLDTQFLQLGAALFAARPEHPILEHCIETIEDDWHRKGAPSKSGPVHFTKSFFTRARVESCGRVLAIPASYLYPLGGQETELKRDEWVDNGAFAVHHWARSWMPPSYRLREFRDLNNEASCESWND